MKRFDMCIVGSEEELDKVEYYLCGYSYSTNNGELLEDNYIWV